MNKAKVMVTGATGYVAGQLIKKLIENGCEVHAAVREPENKEKLKFLNEIAEKSNTKIKYFKSDLLVKDSYKEAMKDCEVVFHTASPFIIDVKDPQEDLINPALEGTRNVLKSVGETASVKKVVLTSSCAAIYGDSVDLQELKNETITEEVWNNSSSIQHNPYSYSKTLAEKEAWRINEKQNHWKLICVNPSLVVGPGISPLSKSSSFDIIKQLGDGTMKSGVPDWEIGLVDVREVAKVHFQAAFNPNAHGRYITSAHNSSLMQMGEVLAQKFGNNYSFPRKILPKFLVWLVAPFFNKNMTRKSVARNVGYSWRADNSKSIEDLGVKYRPLDESLHEMFQQMIDYQLV